MSDAYDRKLRELAHQVGDELGFGDFLKEGVYCVLGGPSFETIAECRMLHSMGADAVGESTNCGHWNMVTHTSPLSMARYRFNYRFATEQHRGIHCFDRYSHIFVLFKKKKQD